jgi:lipoprotein-releasing system ATP-binding protein
MIEAKNIHKSYGDLEVLKGLDIYIKKNEIITFVGPSGAGKTTFLQILGTLSKPTKGQVLINGTDINQMNDKNLARFRNENIGFVFQFHQLLPEFSAIENVCIPAWMKGEQKNETIDKAKELLSYLNLSHRFEHKPSELSGGEQQRVAVARSLINDPQVIFADEPSGNLDTKSKKELHELFFTLRDKFNQTFIIVTHNNELAQMSDRMVKIVDGLIE